MVSHFPDQSNPAHTPDYIVIGQMLDNPEKAPLRNQEEATNYDEPSHDTMSTVLISPQSPHPHGENVYYQPPEYTSPITPITPITPSESASHVNVSGTNSLHKSTTLRGPSERITIPTKNNTLSSGFPYDRKVHNLISHDEWYDLSSDIVTASKVTFGEDWGAWTTGITTGTLSSAFIVFFGPVAGYYAGRAVHRKTVVKVAKERLERDGDIRSVLRRWNEQTFQRRGFQVWLELPVDGAEVKEPKEKDKPTDSKQAKALKEEKRVQEKIARRFKIVIIPNSGESQSFLGQDALCESPLEPLETPLVEAMGNELKDPVELDPTRDPVELDERPSRVESENQRKKLPVMEIRRKVVGLEGTEVGTSTRSSSRTPIDQAPPVELDAGPVPSSKHENSRGGEASNPYRRKEDFALEEKI